MHIDSYNFGTVTVDGRAYGSDVILLPPDVVGSWWRRESHRLAVDDLAQVIAYRPASLVVGSGESGMMQVPESTIRDLGSRGIRVEIFRTGEAGRRFNELMKEGEKTAAVLHLTC